MITRMIPNSGRELILSSLYTQKQLLHDLICQLEDNSRIEYGSGCSHERLADMERSIRRVRRIFQRHDN